MTNLRVRNEESRCILRRIKMTEHSKRIEAEVDIAVTWLDQDRWEEISGEKDWKELVSKKGIESYQFFDELFAKPVKKR
jgi:hypothetical protein